jgi:hypothetical protein
MRWVTGGGGMGGNTRGHIGTWEKGRSQNWSPGVWSGLKWFEKNFCFRGVRGGEKAGADGVTKTGGSLDDWQILRDALFGV